MARSGFRSVTTLGTFLLAAYAGVALFCEIFVPDEADFPSTTSRVSAPATGPGGSLAEFMSPFLGHAESRSAMALAFQALSLGDKGSQNAKATNQQAQTAIRRALSWTPYESRGWLALAMLQAQADQNDRTIAEPLKMSYFTAPNDAALMPLRLDTTTRFGALADGDLSELARGDVRTILTRQPNQRVALSNAYKQGSPQGRMFLEETVRAIDPAFVPSLSR